MLKDMTLDSSKFGLGVKNDMTCKFCLSNQNKVVFSSCGHCSCFGCADKLKYCPICRKTISTKNILVNTQDKNKDKENLIIIM